MTEFSSPIRGNFDANIEENPDANIEGNLVSLAKDSGTQDMMMSIENSQPGSTFIFCLKNYS